MTKSLAMIAMACATALGSAGCGADHVPSTAATPGDPGYVYGHIAKLRGLGVLDTLEPRHLADALPNREVVVQTDLREVRGDFSDLVVVGRVVGVRADEGIRYPHADPTYTGDEEEAVEIVGFHDPRAHERSIVVTIDPEWSAGDATSGRVRFRIGVPGDADPTAFLAGLLGMGTAVALLDQIEDGRHRGEYYPILNGAALGSVTPTGGLAFTGLGSQELDFLGGITSLSELKGEAGRPTVTLRY